MRVLHKAQQTIAKSVARFKILRCGRRFGKTTYAVEEMVAAALYQPHPVAYFATTYDRRVISYGTSLYSTYRARQIL